MLDAVDLVQRRTYPSLYTRKERERQSKDEGKILICPSPFARNVVCNRRKRAKQDPFPVGEVGLPKPW
jgi:hypothetical protein